MQKQEACECTQVNTRGNSDLLEGRAAVHEKVQKAAQRPHICALIYAAAGGNIKELGRSVRSAAVCFCFFLHLKRLPPLLHLDPCWSCAPKILEGAKSLS